jgi:AcrR family transcriptional regulator
MGQPEMAEVTKEGDGESSREQLKAELRSAREGLYRERILEAAEQVFAEGPFEAVGIREIAERAGLSVGSVYSIFEGKEALFRAVHERRSAELFERMAEVIDAEAGPIALIEQGIEETVRFFCERPSYLRMHLQDRTAWALEGQSTEVQSESWQRGRELMRVAFATGMREGTFFEGDPESNARMVMAMHQVKLAEWVAAEPRPSSDEVARDLKLLFHRAFVKGSATSA